jgi:hypothetical protein
MVSRRSFIAGACAAAAAAGNPARAGTAGGEDFHAARKIARRAYLDAEHFGRYAASAVATAAGADAVTPGATSGS